MQCRELCWEHLRINLNTLSCKNVFSRGFFLVEGGGVFLCPKIDIPGRRGTYVKFPLW